MPVLLEPAYQDIAITVCLAVKLNWTRITILILFGRDHWPDVQVENVLVNPVGAITITQNVDFLEKPPRERPNA